MCSFVVDKYLARNASFESIFLVEYVAFYSWDSKKIKRRRKPHVIRHVRYNKHHDPDNYYRENLMLFVPYQEQDETLKQDQHGMVRSFLAT